MAKTNAPSVRAAANEAFPQSSSKETLSLGSDPQVAPKELGSNAEGIRETSRLSLFSVIKRKPH
jgi:hypothetical protein